MDEDCISGSKHDIMKNGDEMKKIRLVLAGLLLLSGCSSTQQTKTDLTKYDTTMMDVGFDTFVSLIGYTDTQEHFQEYASLAKETFVHYNALFDRYNNYEGIANIKTINDQAGITPVTVDQEIIDVLLKTKEYYERSAGQYDVTMGAVLEIWHTYREEAEALNAQGKDGNVPSLEELEAAKQCTGWDKVEIDDDQNTVFINQTCASIDVGSVAKGYATEKTAQALQEKGLTHAIVNAGGNVRLIGEKPNADSWNVGIQLPTGDQSASLANVYIKKDSSFVTSGDYQRYYTVQDKRYHHIVDPETLLPANHFRSVTIVTSDSGLADILSTTLFTMTYEDGSALLKKLQSEGINVEAAWVFDDTTQIPNVDTIQTSKDFKLIISDGLKDMVKIVE